MTAHSTTVRRPAAALGTLVIAACSGSPSPPPATAPTRTAMLEHTVPAKPALERFVSFNVPNLHYVEDDFRFEARDRFRLPDDYEIADALDSVRQLGGTVVRIYALSVRKADDPPERVRHVNGPGAFDELAFAALDRVLAAAAERGLRVIVPFVDNWQWWGGVAQYAAFRGKSQAEFWTDPELIADFERTIDYVLSRRNTVNGRQYRDDETIYAWETGNELQAPWAWTAHVAAFIRQRDPRHPVIDGFHSARVRDEAIADPNIGLLTTHHYTGALQTIDAIRWNVDRIAGKKPYFVGELGLVPAADIERMLDEVVRQPEVLGALLWSLRFHRREGGFYWHWERDDYASYHWPGFASGDLYGERAVLTAVRNAAFRLRKAPVPPLPVPNPPRFLAAATPLALSWQGAAGAQRYAVERAAAPDGPWQRIADAVSDADNAYQPLYADHDAVLGQRYYYRAVAHNAAGSSQPSNVIGPVTATYARLIDDLSDASRAMSATAVEFRSGEAARFKMDASRARGSERSALVYRVPGRAAALRIQAYQWDPEARLVLELSHDGRQFSPVVARVTDFGRQDLIDAFHPVAYEADLQRAGFVRIRFAARTEIGRVEIDYLPD